MNIGNCKRIGIMGGTFNPIHFGHLILAQYALEEYSLDKIWFMPSKRPPHKPEDTVIPDFNRREMTELAIAGNSDFELSDIELKREGSTYTVDTLKQIKTDYPDNHFYFIIGGDSLFQIEFWKDTGTIFSLVEILAASRYHMSEQMLREQILRLNDIYHGRIMPISVPAIDISSKMIRERIKNGKSIQYLLPEPVAAYILENGLYRNDVEKEQNGCQIIH